MTLHAASIRRPRTAITILLVSTGAEYQTILFRETCSTCYCFNARTMTVKMATILFCPGSNLEK